MAVPKTYPDELPERAVRAADVRRGGLNSVPRRPGPHGPTASTAVLPRLLALLPRDQRLVLEVLYLDELTNEEAAQLLGLPCSLVTPAADAPTRRGRVAAPPR